MTEATPSPAPAAPSAADTRCGLVAVIGAIGALIGASVTGRLDLRAAFDAARGRRVG